ncbi:baseplate J/gp47 family protein [soil metagenome]
MSLLRPSIFTLIARWRSDVIGKLRGADSGFPRSVLDVLGRGHSAAMDGAYGNIASTALNIMPDTADFDHLVRQASMFGINPKGAAASTGPMILAGLGGAILPPNSVLIRPDLAEFIVKDSVALVDGAATVSATAMVPGKAGDTAPGTVFTFASPAAGIGATATVGDAGLTGGLDQESRESLLARYLARTRTPPNGGSMSDYEAWALAQPGVTRAWPYPGWMGAGTVGLTFVFDGREDIFPTEDDVAAMAVAIEPLRPATANVVVFAPTPLLQNFTVRLVPSNAATQAAAKAEMADLFAREAKPGGILPISHIREAIAVAAGVTDYDLQVPAAGIVPPAGYMPKIGTWTFL